MEETKRERNLELGRRMNDLSNARDDAIWEMFSPGVVYHVGDQTTTGWEQAKAGDERLFAAIPDARRTIDMEVANDSLLVQAVHFDGTVAATGRRVRWELTSWMRFEDGLIVEAWTHWDPSQLQPRRAT